MRKRELQSVIKILEKTRDYPSENTIIININFVLSLLYEDLKTKENKSKSVRKSSSKRMKEMWRVYNKSK